MKKKAVKANAANPASPFEALEAVVLAIEWEIDDRNMRRFAEEVDRLRRLYRDDKILYSFLQLQGSIGKYIAERKVAAHPDSIQLLHSVFEALKRVVSASGMGDAEKKRILSNEIKKFKDLKEKILKARKAASEGPQPGPAPSAEPKPPAAPPRPESPHSELEDKDLAAAVDELKTFIREEIRQLKQELLSQRPSSPE